MSTIAESDQLYYRKGQTYSRSESDARIASVPSGNRGAVTPSSAAPGNMGSGQFVTFNQAGSYTNFPGSNGQPIVIPAPGTGAALFDAKLYYNGSFYTPSYLTVTLPAASNKIAPWAAQAYNINDQVSNVGKFWYANVATAATDIPGTSPNWSSLLTGYDGKLDASSLGTEILYTDNLLDKSTYTPDTTIRTDTGGFLGAVGARVYSMAVLPAKGSLSVSGIYTGGGKAYRFLDASGALLVFAGIGSTQAQVLNITIPATAATFQIVGKSESNPTTAADALMVNYGATAKPWVQFSFTYINAVSSLPVNPKPKQVAADTDQTTDLPFLVLGADGFIRLLSSRFIYNPANGFTITAAFNINNQTLTGLKTAVNDSDAVPLSQVNSAISPINQAMGNQSLIPIPDLMTDPDVPVIETISTVSAFTTALTVPWSSPVLSILGGALTQASAGYPQSGYGVPRYATGANLNPPVTVEFTFTGSTFEMLTMGQGQVFRLLVDGKFANKSFTSIGANGNIYFQKITFSTTKKRRITIEGGVGFFFGGIRYPSGSSVGTSDRSATQSTFTIGSVVHYMSRMAAYPTAVFLGDSYTEPTGTTAQQGYASIMGKALGWNAVLSGSGGTGYINPGTTGRVKFGDRFANDVAALNPDIIVLAGGINDGAQATETFRAAVRAVFVQAKAVASAKEVVVLSSWHNKGMQFTPTQQILNDGVLKALAAEFGFIYVDASPLITGNGNSANPNGSGNADLYIGGDGTHPNDAGHTYLGLNCAAIYLAQKNRFVSSGTPARRMIDAADINTTGLANTDGQNLPVITAGRVYTPPPLLDGKSFKIANYNTAASFAWTFAAGTVKDILGNAITAIPNGSIVNLFGSVKAGCWLKE